MVTIKKKFCPFFQSWATDLEQILPRWLHIDTHLQYCLLYALYEISCDIAYVFSLDRLETRDIAWILEVLWDL